MIHPGQATNNSTLEINFKIHQTILANNTWAAGG